MAAAARDMYRELFDSVFHSLRPPPLPGPGGLSPLVSARWSPCLPFSACLIIGCCKSFDISQLGVSKIVQDVSLSFPCANVESGVVKRDTKSPGQVFFFASNLRRCPRRHICTMADPEMWMICPKSLEVLRFTLQ